ncbi:MAG: TonB family protein [Sandaracinaceae bacterium]
MRRFVIATALALSLSACGSSTDPEPAPVRAASPPTDTTPPTFEEDTALHADAPGAPDDEARSVTLHWTAAEDDEGVVAYLVSVDDGEPTRVDADTTEATLEGATFAEARRFSVRAVDEAGNESEALSTEDALAPSFPDDARADVEPELPAATLRWPEAQDDVGVVGYAIVGDDEEIARLGPEVRSYRVAEWDQAERYEVAALDAAGHKTRLPVRVVQQQAESAQQALLLAMIGSARGDGLGDILRGGAVSNDLDDVLAQSAGVGVASAASGGDLRAREGGGGGLTSLRSVGSVPAAAPVTRVRGRVEIGPLAEDSGPGTFDANIVTRHLRARLRAIQRCYERELRTDATLAGRVLVRFTITERGVVQGARAEENTTGSPATAACVVNTVRRFRFNPGAQGGDVTFAFPLTFSPQP